MHRSISSITTMSWPAQRPNDEGTFSFEIAASGRYGIRASAPTFQPGASPIIYVSATSEAELNVTLGTPTLTQQVTVTATGAPTPEAQTGASVTVIPAEDFRYSTEVQDPLRLVPGLQMTQSGSDRRHHRAEYPRRCDRREQSADRRHSGQRHRRRGGIRQPGQRRYPVDRGSAGAEQRALRL